MATAQEKALEAALARYAPAIERAFLEAINDTRGAVDLRALVDALRLGDLDRAMALIEAAPARALALQEAVRAAFIQAGINTATPNAIAGVFAFNGRSPRAETWLNANAADMVQVVRGDTDTRIAIRQYLVEGMESGRGANKVALDIVGRIEPVSKKRAGGVLGLTAQQVEYAMNFRRRLETLDPDYVKNTLRDKRFDPMIRKAIKSGKPLARADIDRITARYRDKMLAYRGKMIARNEAFSAQAAAQYEAHLQILELPNVAGVFKRWQHNLSKEPRLEHLAMNGTVLPIQQDFMFGGVLMSHPHDPRGGAAHSIGCRCVAIYRVELV
jgi:hypothetical protein